MSVHIAPTDLQRGFEGSAVKKLTPAGKREAVAHLQMPFGMSEPQASAVVGADRENLRYQ